MSASTIFWAIAIGLVVAVIVLIAGWFLLGMPGKRLDNSKDDDYGSWGPK